MILPDSPHQGRKLALILLPLGVMLASYLYERLKGRRHALLTILFLAVVSTSLESLHNALVDTTLFFPPELGYKDNTEWQIALHQCILDHAPGMIPHSYRFLPDYIVAGIERTGVGFAYSRDIYRHVFAFLLVYSIFAFSRLFVAGPGPFLTVLGYGLIYASSIRCYAGQLMDPMSHLSFVLSFILIFLGHPLLLFLTVSLGICAKESVVVMTGFYLLYHFFKSRSWVPGVLLVLSSLAVVVAIRWWILRGTFDYTRMSGVPPDWYRTNLGLAPWPRQVLFTIGVLVPFVVMGWRSTPPFLKALILYLTPILLISNVMFSWLRETRNLVPASIAMLVVASQVMVSASANPVEKESLLHAGAEAGELKRGRSQSCSAR
jgi:hypothetical protein